MNTDTSQAPLQILGRAAAGLRLDNLPAEVLLRSRQRVLDTLGCLVASLVGYSVGMVLYHTFVPTIRFDAAFLAQQFKPELRFIRGRHQVHRDAQFVAGPAHRSDPAHRPRRDQRLERIVAQAVVAMLVRVFQGVVHGRSCARKTGLRAWKARHRPW